MPDTDWQNAVLAELDANRVPAGAPPAPDEMTPMEFGPPPRPEPEREPEQQAWPPEQAGAGTVPPAAEAHGEPADYPADHPADHPADQDVYGAVAQAEPPDGSGRPAQPAPDEEEPLIPGFDAAAPEGFAPYGAQSYAPEGEEPEPVPDSGHQSFAYGPAYGPGDEQAYDAQLGYMPQPYTPPPGYAPPPVNGDRPGPDQAAGPYGPPPGPYGPPGPAGPYGPPAPGYGPPPDQQWPPSPQQPGQYGPAPGGERQQYPPSPYAPPDQQWPQPGPPGGYPPGPGWPAGGPYAPGQPGSGEQQPYPPGPPSPYAPPQGPAGEAPPLPADAVPGYRPAGPYGPPPSPYAPPPGPQAPSGEQQPYPQGQGPYGPSPAYGQQPAGPYGPPPGPGPQEQGPSGGQPPYAEGFPPPGAEQGRPGPYGPGPQEQAPSGGQPPYADGFPPPGGEQAPYQPGPAEGGFPPPAYGGEQGASGEQPASFVPPPAYGGGGPGGGIPPLPYGPPGAGPPSEGFAPPQGFDQLYGPEGGQGPGPYAPQQHGFGGPGMAPGTAPPPEALAKGVAHGDPMGRRMRRMVGGGTAKEMGRLAEQIRQPVPSPRRVAISSIRGGSGKTTIAALVSTVFAHYREDPVLVIDADPDLGSLALRLGIAPQRTLAELAEAEPPRSFEELVPYLVQHPSGLWVLPGTRRDHTNHQLSQGQYDAALDAASRFFAITVIDCGAGLLNELSGAVLDGANALSLVTAGTVDGALSANGALDWLSAEDHAQLIQRTLVTLVTHAPHQATDLGQARSMLQAHGCGVIELPYDRQLAAGTVLDPSRLAESTRVTAMRIAATLLGSALH